MKLIDEIKLNALLFLYEDKIFTSFSNYDYYVSNIKIDNNLDILFKSGCSQIVNNKGFSFDNPINDIFKMLNINYKKLKSDYKGLKQKFIIDKFELSNSKESIIIYHRIYTSDINLENLTTNIDKIDKSKNCFNFCELNVLASRPAMGVSSLMIQLGYELSQFHNVVFFTTNDNCNDVTANFNRYIDESPGFFMNSNLNILKLQTNTKELKSVFTKIFNAVVFIDDFKLYEKVLSIKYLKDTAVSNKLSILIGSTLKRTVETRYRSIPTTDDLVFSVYKQSFFDKIIFLRRPYYYNLNADRKKISLTFIKNGFKQIIKCKLSDTKFLKIDM
jgi:hypothetical protein